MHDLDGSRLIRLVVWREGERGSPLEVWLVGGMFITPGEVAAAIAFSRAHGWTPRGGRSPHRLRPDGGFTLPGWRVSPPPIKRWAPKGPAFSVTLGRRAGKALAAELQIECVTDSQGEWQNDAFLVRDQGRWTSAFTRSFTDLLALLGAARGGVQHVDGVVRRVPRQFAVLNPEEALRVAGSAPFADARALGNRVWLSEAGDVSCVECITLDGESVWRWLTITSTGVVDRRRP
jgi:hypothetical protein